MNKSNNVGKDLNDYERLSTLSGGGFGMVIKARRKTDDALVCVKITLLDRFQSLLTDERLERKMREIMIKEAEVLITFDHPNIVKANGFFQCRDDEMRECFCIDMEFCAGGDMNKAIKQKKNEQSYFTEQEIMYWFCQLITTVNHLHKLGIIHRDIKPDNILFADNDRIIAKLADFGIASQQNFDSLTRTMVGTVPYMAPEYFGVEVKSPTFKCDVWALGIVLYELAALDLPFHDLNNQIGIISMLLSWQGVRNKSLTNHYSADFVRLLNMLLEKDPEQRPTLDLLIADPYIKRHIAATHHPKTNKVDLEKAKIWKEAFLLNEKTRVIDKQEITKKLKEEHDKKIREMQEEMEQQTSKLKKEIEMEKQQRERDREMFKKELRNAVALQTGSALQALLPNYNIIRELAEGGQGRAILAKRGGSDGILVVVKEIPLFKIKDDKEYLTRARREAKLMTMISHPNIVLVLNVFENVIEKRIYIEMEYCAGGDMDTIISERRKAANNFTENEIKQWMKQTCEAIGHLHANKIVHRDVKPANIFFTTPHRNVVKLGDFGLAKLRDATKTSAATLDDASTILGTTFYMSPEALDGDTAEYKRDVWSVGVILYELAMLQKPFFADDIQAVIAKIIRNRRGPPIADRYSAAYRLLVDKCLEPDVKERFSIDEVLKSNRLGTGLPRTVIRH